MQNPIMDNLAKRYLALSSTSGEFTLFDLEQMKFEGMVSGIEARPCAMDWVGTSGALVCGDTNGEVHMFL